MALSDPSLSDRDAAVKILLAPRPTAAQGFRARVPGDWHNPFGDRLWGQLVDRVVIEEDIHRSRQAVRQRIGIIHGCPKYRTGHIEFVVWQRVLGAVARSFGKRVPNGQAQQAGQTGEIPQP